MLSCSVELQNFQLTCDPCKKCSASSKGVYSFDEDLKDSEWLVNQLKELVEKETSYHCDNTDVHKNPDIQVRDKDGVLICRIEAKMLMDKPFMKVQDFLPGHDLYPKETIVVDLPKLVSYFDRWKKDDGIPTYIVWYLGRPCDDVGGITVFQEISVLHYIFMMHSGNRCYRRKTGTGDFKNGKQFGVTEKYHFSIQECRPISELCAEICNPVGQLPKNPKIPLDYIPISW